MTVATCRVLTVGELTLWGRQFLQGLQKANLIELVEHPNLQAFLASPAMHQPEILMVEVTPENRQTLIKVRQSNRPVIFVWYGRSFTKEDLVFALHHRIYCVFENPRADDKRILEWLQKISVVTDRSEQYAQVTRSVKGVLLQAETEDPRPLLNELRTAVSKLERLGLCNEFMGVTQANVEAGEERLPFHRAQGFGDALATVHSLERTGALSVRGKLGGEEGRVEFLQGKVVAAHSGDVRGLKALYRMFLWDTPKFLFSRKDPRESNLEEQLNMNMKYIVMEGEDLKRRFDRVRRDLPPNHIVLELEPRSLHPGIQLTGPEFSTLASVVEFGKVGAVLDYNSLPDVTLVESLIQLRRLNLVRVAGG